MTDLLPFDTGITRRRRRTTDPDTSHQAARQVGQFAHDHHVEIMRVLETAAAPMTARAIAQRCGLDHIAVSRRMHELVRDGLACDSGERHITETGRKAIAWRTR